MDLMYIGKIKKEQERIYNEGDVIPPYYIFSASALTAEQLMYYNDITSNVSWATIGENFYDWKFIKRQLDIYTYTIGWDNLTLADKKIAAQYFCVEREYRDQILTPDEEIRYWKELYDKMAQARLERWNAVRIYMSYELTTAEAYDLSLSTTELSNNYLVNSIESEAIDGLPGIFDFVAGTSVYVDNGYPSKSYYNVDHQKKMLDILVEGIY